MDVSHGLPVISGNSSYSEKVGGTLHDIFLINAHLDHAAFARCRNLPHVAIAQILRGSFSTSRMISKASCIAGSWVQVDRRYEAKGVQHSINDS